MDELSQKTKQRLLILPLIPISIALLYSIIIEIFFRSSVGASPFCDYHVFKKVFAFYPNIYDYYWYIYTPAFLIEFFWINFLPFYFGVLVWVILKIIIIVIIWRVLLYSKEVGNFFELLIFVILVLVLGMVNEIYTENSDTILLACGMLGYLCLDKAQKIQNDETYTNKSLSKNQVVVLLNLFAGFITAYGMFKPLFIIILPVLLIKANRRFIFISIFIIWILASNILIFIYPELLGSYIERVSSGQTLVGGDLLFKNNILNILFRNGFTPFRVQIWLFPTIMIYVNQFIKNEKIRKYWALYYAIGFAIFNILSLILLALGF